MRYALGLVLGAAGEPWNEELEGLESVLAVLANEVRLIEAIAILRAESAAHARSDDLDEAKAALRTRAEELAPVVHDGLDALAQSHGWTDRVRR